MISLRQRAERLDIRALALALHEWEGSAEGGELNCYTCAQWPDDNTPDYQPKPGDVCWDGAVDLAAAYRAALEGEPDAV